jgi:hypothetical protein
MRRPEMKTMCALLVALFAISGCKKGSPRAQAGEAQKLLAAFTAAEADAGALSGNLRPKPEDYAAVFEGDSAEKLKANLEPLWDSGKLVLKPLPGANEVEVRGATRDELKKGDGNATYCPEDYKQVADRIKSDVMVYCFTFKKPGEQSGLRGDGLVYVKDHWAFFPKAYRYLK